MNNDIQTIKTTTLPLLPIRGLPVFPYMIIHFDVGRSKSINAIEECMIEDQLIMLSAQKDPEMETVSPDDIYSVGTIAKVKQVLKIADGDVRVLVEGISRARIERFTSTSPYFECEVSEYVSYKEKTEQDRIKEDAYLREITKSCGAYFSLLGKFEKETIAPPSAVSDADQFADIVAAAIPTDLETKQAMLEEFDTISRMEKILEVLHSETEILKLEQKISHKVKDKIDKTMKGFTKDE